MKNKILNVLLIATMVLTLSSCGKVPQAKIDATNVAIEAAKVAEAPIYLPVEFTALHDSMTVINAAVENQKSKMFKKFGTINEKLDSTIAAANRLTIMAPIRKDEIKKNAETLLNEVKAQIDKNAELLSKAPRGKEGAVVLESMKADVAAVETTTNEAQALYDAGSYMDALEKAKNANDKISGVNTELTDAIAKVRR
jgi:hypothetical protein